MAFHEGPHSKIVVYIDRAIAALALHAVTAIIRDPTRSRTGILALEFALALIFPTGGLTPRENRNRCMGAATARRKFSCRNQQV
jgi:hypothetical protein